METKTLILSEDNDSYSYLALLNGREQWSGEIERWMVEDDTDALIGMVEDMCDMKFDVVYWI